MGKSLSSTELEQVKKMAKEGIAPEDISDKFGTAISTIHYYKAKWAKEGVKFPDLRGKRPKGNFKPGIATATTKAITKREGGLHGHSTVMTLPSTNDGALNFIINGVSIQIKGHPKSVQIQQNYIHIDF